MESEGDLCGSRSCYEIHQSQDKGRYLVASHTIDKNQVVLQDRAYVVGPFTVSMPLCLNCHVSPLTLEKTRECPGGCGYRVCIDCQNQRPMETLHHRLECPILANAISIGTFSWVIFIFIYRHSEKNHAPFVHKMGFRTFSSFGIARGRAKIQQLCEYLDKLWYY